MKKIRIPVEFIEKKKILVALNGQIETKYLGYLHFLLEISF